MTLAAEPTLSPPSRTNLGSRVVLRGGGLRKAFGGQVVLDGVDLELRQGEVVLLRGENGSGKTTLLNLLTGSLEPDAGEIHYSADDTPRSYRFPRRWWQDLNPWDHFRPEFVAQEGIGRTWQDVRLFGAQTLRDNIAVAEPGHPGENPLVALFAPSRAEGRERELNREADSMLERLGLGGREESSADKISLGQSKRVAIARAVAAGAKILFLDEPLAGLDRQGIADVLVMLNALVREGNLTLVVVEHIFNQPHLHGLVTTDWLLEDGRIQKSEFISQEFPLQLPASSRPSWFSLLTGDEAEILDEPLPRGAVLTRIRRSDRWKPGAKPVLEVKNLVVKRGPRTVVGLDEQGERSGFNLTLHEGEIAILQAPNGWGKSTLFDAIAGLTTSSALELQMCSSSIAGLNPWQRRNVGLCYLPSGGYIFPSLSVQELQTLLAKPETRSSNTSTKEKLMGFLSGGELQRLKFSAVTRSNLPAKILCLDEPFNALDGSSCGILANNLLKTSYSCIFAAIPTSFLYENFNE